MKKITRTGIIVSLLLALYVSSYIVLSIGGRYEPSAIGLNGVKGYTWAPTGFVSNYKWNRWLQILYLPLWGCDIRFWHSPRKSYTGHYPIDYVEQKDIWKVYKAWGGLKETKPPSKISEKKHAVLPEPQVAKDAIIELVRQNPDTFLGHPDPKCLADCPLQHLRAQQWQFGRFVFDLNSLAYSATIGNEDSTTHLYEGKLLWKSGHMIAQPPRCMELDPATRQQSQDRHWFPDAVERAMLIEAQHPNLARPQPIPPESSTSHNSVQIIGPIEPPSSENPPQSPSKTSPKPSQ